MSEVYLLHFEETSDEPLVYASEKKAKAVLWEAYQKDVVPDMRKYYPEKTVNIWVEADRETLEKRGFIEDYGWITHCFVNEEEE